MQMIIIFLHSIDDPQQQKPPKDHSNLSSPEAESY